jgi:hypothetical protein
MMRGKRKAVVEAPASWPSWAPPDHVQLVLTGTPRTKKNHNVMVKDESLVLPSVEWRKWARGAEVRMQPPTASTVRGVAALTPPGFGYLYDVGQLLWTGLSIRAMLPKQHYNCAALIYRHADVGDAVGFYQGIADLLELRRVVTNDRQIRQWDGSRLLVARDREDATPCVVLALTPL